MNFGGGIVKSINFTTSWGLSPGSGQATVLGAFSIATGQDFAATFGGATVYGVVKNPVLNLDAAGGEVWTVPLVDNREKLSWDTIQCYFNQVEIVEVDPATFGLARRRRYKHCYPDNWHAQIVTYTNNPLTGTEILNKLFSASSVRYSWTYVSHAKLANAAYNIDADTGAALGTVVQQVLEKLGLLMTMSGEYRLSFCVKGDGSLPTYSGSNIKESNIGDALSNQAPAVVVVGDRNIYQVLTLDLVPDWKSFWESYLFEGDWLDAVRDSYSLPSTTPSHRANIAAKARTISVLDWCIKTNDARFADYGRFADVSRMSIPAWIYINEIVFKAYKISTNGSGYPQPDGLNGIPLTSLVLKDGLLARATYDPDSGNLSYYNNGGQLELYTDDKAFIIAKGQPLDLSDPAKRDVLDPSTSGTLRDKWYVQNRFKLDHRNYSVIFDEPVFLPGTGDNGLFVFVNSETDLPPDHPSRHLVIPNAECQITAAPARGSFCFEAERYSRSFGSGMRKTSNYVSGLAMHALMEDGAFRNEIKYDTSPQQTADQAAQKAASSFLAKQDIYASGGVTRLGTAGTTLTATIDRATYTLDGEGLRETVDFTKERGPDYFESERELERRTLSNDLYPNMAENRQSARDYGYLSKVLAGLGNKTGIRKYRTVNDVWTTPVGNIHSAPTTMYPTVAYDVGEVMFTNAAGIIDVEGKIFQGVVVCQNCQANKAHPVATQGTVPVKIKGKCKIGDLIGVNAGEKFGRVNGTRSFGRVTQEHTTEGTVWLPVRISVEPAVVRGPFDFISLGDDGKLRLSPGTVNQLIPDDPLDPIDCSGATLTYVKLHCKTDTNQVNQVQWVADGTSAKPAAALKGGPPAEFDVAIALVVKRTVGDNTIYDFYKLWPDGFNVLARPVEWMRTDRAATPTVGQTPQETWYSWAASAGYG